MSHDLLVTRDGGVLRMTIDRPEKLNALTRSTIDALRAGFEEAGRDAATRVVLLTGGGRAFCAGQDLGDPSVVPGSDLGEMLERHYNPLVRAMRELQKPVLARVNGIAAGAGANLAFACDIVIAAASAKFVESFSRMGFVRGYGGTWMLPRLVGQARAVALAMLGSPIDAQRAYEWGAIWKVVPDDELDEACDELAHALARAPTKALAAIKAAMMASWSRDLDAQLEIERDAQGMLGATRDFHEGVEAFTQKRDPSFQGE